MSKQNISNKSDIGSETNILKKIGSARSVILSVIAAMVAIYAMIFSTIAWISKNNAVHSDMEMMLNTRGQYELATGEGYTSPYSAENAPLHDYAGQEGVEYSFGENTLYRTTNSQPCLEWRLTDESNTKFLQPGSQGKLTYYIIPPETAEVNKEIPIQFEIEGFDAKGQPVSDERAMQLLNGHILFFNKYENDTYSDWLKDQVQTVTVEGNQVKEVTIYWVWPWLYGNLTAFDGSSVRPICDSDGEDYQALLDNMTKFPEQYFYFKDDSNPDSVPDDNTKNNAFNEADEYIGENISYLLLKAKMR